MPFRIYIKEKLIDGTALIVDSLQKYPISKGLLPSGVLASPALFNMIEGGLKITLLIISILGAGLTAYSQYLKIKKLKSDGGKK